MNQAAHQALTAMWNSFAPNGQDYRLLAATYDSDLANLTNEAIIEAAQRFRLGQVGGQSKTFSPSLAEFAEEATRIHHAIPLRERRRIEPPPPKRPDENFSREHKVRMHFKMNLLSASLALGKVDDVARANAEGLDSLMALAQQWGVPIPEELWDRRAA